MRKLRTLTAALAIAIVATVPQTALAAEQAQSGLVLCFSNPLVANKYLSFNIYTQDDVFNCTQPVEIQIYLTVYEDSTGTWQLFRFHWPNCNPAIECLASLDMQNLHVATYRIESEAWFQVAGGGRGTFPLTTQYVTITGGPSSPAP